MFKLRILFVCAGLQAATGGIERRRCCHDFRMSTMHNRGFKTMQDRL